MIGLNRRIIMVIVVVSLGVLIGLGSLPGEEAPGVVDEGPDYTVTLGFISATQHGLPQDTFLIRLAENDINEYCVENGIQWRFHFKITCADGQAQNAHDLTREFAENGTKLVGGYAWSSFLCSGARTTASDFNMTLISISSTSPIMAIPDTAFRLCPHDLKQVEPLLVMLSDFDVQSIIIIQRGDAWADGIVDEFQSRYSGTIVKTIRYPGEATELGTYFERAQTAYLEYNSTEKPSILLVSFTEASSALAQLSEYPTLYNMTWFGTDGTVNDQMILDEAGEQASKVGLLSPKLGTQALGPDFLEMNNLYKAEFGYGMDFYQANVYDCCWLMAHLVINTNTTGGATLQSSILEVASNHSGITGALSLDENGDRIYAPYTIWGYFAIDGGFASRECGYYDPVNGVITWDINLVKIK